MTKFTDGAPAPSMAALAGDSEENPVTDIENSGGEAVQAKPETAVTKKKVTKKKAVDAGHTPATEDSIQETAIQVENLKAPAARKLATDLVEADGFNLFKLGGVLAIIYDKKFYEGYGFETFAKFVEDEHGMKYRKAMYLINIYTKLVEANIEWATVKHLGWTKLRVIADHLTHENASEWITRSEGMTVAQLEDYIRSMNAGGTSEEADDAAKTTTMTFKVHADQKDDIRASVDKAKAEFGTEFDNIALHHMAMAYISGNLGKTSVKVDDVVKKAGVKGIQASVSKVFGVALTENGEAPVVESLAEQVAKMELVPLLELVEAAFPEAEISVTIPEVEEV